MNLIAINKKNGVLKLMTVVISLALLLSIIPILSIDAAVNGSLTFYHGVHQSLKYTYGRIASTEVENSMKINGLINYYSGPKSGTIEPFIGDLVFDCTGVPHVIYPGSVSGSSYFLYYVDGTLQHESTDWWNFDFR